jgi:receptor protein-tyrosine kinase
MRSGVTVELADLVRALRVRWWLPVTGLILVGSIVLALSLLAAPQYTATMQFFVTTRDSASTSEVYEGSQFSQQRVASYARLLTGEELARQVIDELDLEVRPLELAARITATAAPETVLIDVTVSDPSPEQAQRIAEELAERFTSQVEELEATEAGASPVRVTLTDPPEVPEFRSAPQIPRNVAMGAIFGMLLGGGAAIARALLDRSVKDPYEAGDLAGSPILGAVLEDPALRVRHTVDPGRPTRALENYRQLGAQLLSLGVDEPSKTIMISSAMPLEGKSTAVVNLGLALAEAGRQVTILDADLRRSRATHYLGIPGDVGLSDVLAGRAGLADVIQVYGDTGMSVVPAGPVPADPSPLLASAHLSGLLDELRGKNDFVLVDVPAVIPVADATRMVGMVDGVLLSVRYGHSRKVQLEQAATILKRAGAPLLGLILNIVPSHADIAGSLGDWTVYGPEDPKRSPGRRRHRSR